MISFLRRGEAGAAAIVDTAAEKVVTYAELRDRVSAAAEAIRRTTDPGLVFHLVDDSVASVITYLSCLEAGYPAMLLEPDSVDRLRPLLESYEPVAVAKPREDATDASVVPYPEEAYTYRRLTGPAAGAPHPDLALLLTTSGSTGSPKSVRLSFENLEANARSIAGFLELAPGERSMQSLPSYYSYGLSLVNSHLYAGATIVLTDESFLRPAFWGAFDAAKCTSFAGVPYVYETLARLRFDPGKHPTLRTMTQAGGALEPELVAAFHEKMSVRDGHLVVMYGQTEATARISFVPPERLPEKIGTIGIAIPDGHLSLDANHDGPHAELKYRGPNVMLGYAHSAADLKRGDEQGGQLRTGDLASVDGEGFYRIEGRLKRFAKLYGRRISLDEVERDIESRYAVDAATVERAGRLSAFVSPAGSESEALGEGARKALRAHLSKWLRVPATAVEVVEVEQLPRTSAGKKDYGVLAS